MIAKLKQAPELLNDPKLNLSFGSSKTEKNWKNKTVLWSDLLKVFSDPIRTQETAAEYQKMTPAEKDKVKDGKAVVGGFLKKGKRRSDSVQSRSTVILDADSPRGDLWEDVKIMCSEACAIYSTHSHTPDKPRYRLFIPLLRPVTVEEYQPLARKLAEHFGMDNFDDTTYQVERLFYLPSHSFDGEYIFDYQDGPLVDPDAVLAEYPDWANSSYWPESSHSHGIRVKDAKKLGDPTLKDGIIGAFCRTYDIQSAIEKFLPDVYEPTSKDDRYTYLEGSTSGGLVLYDDKFAYSHHGTDPVGDRLNNAFDLVRIHLFSELDEDVKEGTMITKYPSFKAMSEYAQSDKVVFAEWMVEEFGDDFEDKLVPEWLSMSANGKPVIDTHILAEEVKSEFSIIRTNRLLQGAIYNQKTGVWSLHNCKEQLNKIIGEKLGKFSTIHYKRETFDKLWDRVFITRNYDPFIDWKKSELISFENGTYNILTGELSEHAASDYIFHEHKYVIDLEREKEAVLTKEWIDYLSPGSLQFVMEYVGALLYTGLPINAIAFLFGQGSNGKSTFMNHVKKIVGDGNYSTVSLKQLSGKDNRFLTSKLYKALGNIVADIPADFIEDTGILKLITGDDELTGELKGQDAFTFMPYANMMFSCNILPSFSDTSDGWVRRLIVVPFTKRNLRSNKEYMKKYDRKKLEGEIPVFVRECCEAFRSLLGSDSETFYQSEAMKLAKEQWLLNNDNVKKFYSECLIKVISPKHGESAKTIFDWYYEWCDTQGIKNKLKEASFKQKLLTLIGEANTHRSRAWDDVREAGKVTRYPRVYSVPEVKRINQAKKLKTIGDIDVQELSDNEIFDSFI